jgi:4'-phosphopantetheinyl transferase
MEYHAVKFATHEISVYRDLVASKIDPEKRKRIEEKLFQDDRDRALIGTLLSRLVLCRRLGLTNGELRIDTSPSGKPFVIGAQRFDFNIAHSGSWIVCGAGQGRVGVDVERIEEADAGFAERYFAPSEAELLRTLDAASRKRWFYSIWALKESYLKALGTGLAAPLDGFSIRFQADRIRVESKGFDAGFHPKLYQDIDPDFAFAMCGENPPPENARVWTLKNLITDFLRFC